MAKGWGGRRAQSVRAELARTLPAPCSVCGQIVTTDQAWDVDHIEPRAEGGAVWDYRNCAIAHAKCNRARGARQTNQRPPGPPSWNPTMV